MLIAFNAGLVRLLLSVAANALKPESAIQSQSQFLIFSIECLTALEFMMVVYVGNYLWRQLGTDYWGIAMWKTNRGLMIEVSLAAIVVSRALFHSVVFVDSSFSRMGREISWQKPVAHSHGGQTAAILLMCATFAFSEEFLFGDAFSHFLPDGSGELTLLPLRRLLLQRCYGHSPMQVPSLPIG